MLPGQFCDIAVSLFLGDDFFSSFLRVDLFSAGSE
jgi:hypothetical protein